MKARDGSGLFHGLYSSLALGCVFKSQTVLMNFQVSEANAPKDSTVKDYRSCGIPARVRGRRASDRVLVFSILASYQVVRVDRVDVVLIVLVTPQSGFAALVEW